MQTLTHIRPAEASQTARSSVRSSQESGGVAFGDVISTVGGGGERLPAGGSNLPSKGLQGGDAVRGGKPVSTDDQDHTVDDVGEQGSTDPFIAADTPDGLEAPPETQTGTEQEAGTMAVAGWSQLAAQQPTVNLSVSGGARRADAAPGTAVQVPAATPLLQTDGLLGLVPQVTALETAGTDSRAGAVVGEFRPGADGVVASASPLLEGPFRRLLSGDSVPARSTLSAAGQANPMTSEATMPLLALAVTLPGATTDVLAGHIPRQDQGADALALAGLALDGAGERARDETSTSFSLIAGTADGDTPDFGSLSAELRSAPASVRPLSQMTYAPGTPAWADELGDTMLMMVAKDQDVVELRLNPGQLGTLEVRLESEDDKVRVAFFSQSGATREALDAALPRLRELLASGGLQLADAQVSSDAMPRDDTNRGNAPMHMHMATSEDNHPEETSRNSLVRISHEGRVDTFA